MSNEFLSSKLSKLPNLKTLQSKFSELKNFNARLTEMITLFPKSFVGLPIDCLKKEWIKSFKKGLITKEFGQIKILRQSIVDLAILTGKGQRTIERGMTMFFKRSYNFDNINPYSKEWFIFGTQSEAQTTSNQNETKAETKTQAKTKTKTKTETETETETETKTESKGKKSHKLSSNQKLRSIPKSKHNHKLKLNNQVLQTIKTQPELMFAKTEQTNLTQSIFNNESGEQQLNNAKISLNTPLSSTTEREREREGETETETETQRQTKTTDSEQVIRKRRYESKTTETDHLKKRKFLAENDPFDFQDEETPFDHLHETPLNNVLEKIFEENGISYVELDTNGSSHSLIIENEQESHLITEFTNFVPVEQNWYVDLDTSFFDQIDEFVNLDDEESQNFVLGCVCTDPENSNNLEEFFTCIFENYGSEGDRSEFDLPEDQISSWQQVVEDMIKTEIECKSIDLRTLAETTNFKIEEHHGFCILYDTLLESGLSSFVVRKNGTRAVILSAPHPRFDYKTCIQAASIMDIFPAQMLIIAGSRRDTCLNASTCQSNYYVADRAHNTLGDYYGAIEIVKEIFSENNLPELSQIDFHGMSTTTCNGTDVLLSEGIKVEPQDDSLLMKIKESLQEQTSWSIHNYGEQHECDLYGTTNVMGRLYNGVNSNEVCGTFADESYGRFVHIEQKYFIRTDRDTDAFYKNAFLNAFESDSCLPTRELINDKCVIKSDPDPDPDPDPHTESSSLLVSFSQIIFFLQIIFFVLFKR